MSCPFIYGDTYCRKWMHIYIYYILLHANHSETYGSCSGIQAYCCVVFCLSNESGSNEGNACKLSGTLKRCDAGGLWCAYLALLQSFFSCDMCTALFSGRALFLYFFIFLGGGGSVVKCCMIYPKFGQESLHNEVSLPHLH